MANRLRGRIREPPQAPDYAALGPEKCQIICQYVNRHGQQNEECGTQKTDYGASVSNRGDAAGEDRHVVEIADHSFCGRRDEESIPR